MFKARYSNILTIILVVVLVIILVIGIILLANWHKQRKIQKENEEVIALIRRKFKWRQ